MRLPGNTPRLLPATQIEHFGLRRIAQLFPFYAKALIKSRLLCTKKERRFRNEDRR